ncbi:hypothetical protein [Saliniramus fredricksonii]|uniref:hypothetical protein n=1 Tax=Saliniramus fredricksonii TaxID=1653334 RepID=UPI001041E372|nr:hypothetical protein [Saliniramus fredricksonii]
MAAQTSRMRRGREPGGERWAVKPTSFTHVALKHLRNLIDDQEYRCQEGSNDNLVGEAFIQANDRMSAKPKLNS